MKKKPLLLLMLLALLGLMACSSDASGPSSSPGKTPAPSSSSSSSSSKSSKKEGSESDSEKKGNLSISGSTALQPLLTEAVSAFKEESEFAGAITVSGGGSVQGLTDVMNGLTNIGASALSPTQAGLDAAGLVDNQVAVVAICVVVSPDVAKNLTDISMGDLKDLFSGAITDWKDVAGWKGTGLPVQVYHHRPGSGIRAAFETYGLLLSPDEAGTSQPPNLIEVDHPSGLTHAIEDAQGAIGYAAYPYCSALSMLNIDGVEPTYENVYEGKYNLWVCLHLYTKGEPEEAAQSFVEFLKSSEFEETITKSGYGLISEMKVSR